MSGSQTRGDRLVARLLETLVADPGAVDPGADLRIQLYRMVHDDFGVATYAAAADEAAGADIRIADARLSRIPSLARKALLLTAVEGLREPEAGPIIGRAARQRLG